MHIRLNTLLLDGANWASPYASTQQGGDLSASGGSSLQGSSDDQPSLIAMA